MPEKLTYAAAGVDLDAADEAVSRIGKLARRTYTPNVLAGVGPFSGLFRLDLKGYADPVLVSSCDGVGTKLKLAIRWNRHSTIGADLVNHCVNDILTSGARPLTFLDYIAIAKMDPEVVAAIIEGFADACGENGVALIGGETAEMPGIYKSGDYDVAGFITGIVERERILDGSRLKAGQALIGLPSSGPHTNGYSLVRRIIFDLNDYGYDDKPEALDGATVGESLLAVHRSYLKILRPLLDADLIHAMAHITGGGIPGNLIRILPENIAAVIDTSLWTVPRVFTFLQQTGQVDRDEMFRVFNMGIGMIIAVDAEHSRDILARLADAGENACVIGHLISAPREVRLK
ncbi:MAG TPA: phosphoribosylformylglycinamidine cyclo-ligase [bacterium]|nr:phosphoribosylformylglycinamidine cyclo-ligase [bacterium]